jgi:hypothetical protein
MRVVGLRRHLRRLAALSVSGAAVLLASSSLAHGAPSLTNAETPAAAGVVADWARHVPVAVAKRIALQVPDLYLPGWLPPGYRFKRWKVDEWGASLTFKRRQALLVWSVSEFPRTSCRGALGGQARIRIAGRTVFYGWGNHGHEAWTCPSSSAAGLLVVRVWDPHRLSKQTQARIAASREPVEVQTPVAVCSDGIDNDGDEKTDYPADPGCASGSDGNEVDPVAASQCSDAVDNDGDGAADYPADIGCSSVTDVDEITSAYQCDDGADNDADSLVDYPGDPDCSGRSDTTEGASGPPPSNCSPAYTGVCIPTAPPDLDCADVPYSNFAVLPPDPHNFDGDSDGIGCE